MSEATDRILELHRSYRVEITAHKEILDHVSKSTEVLRELENKSRNRVNAKWRALLEASHEAGFSLDQLDEICNR